MQIEINGIDVKISQSTLKSYRAFISQKNGNQDHPFLTDTDDDFAADGKSTVYLDRVLYCLSQDFECAVQVVLEDAHFYYHDGVSFDACGCDEYLQALNRAMHDDAG